MTITTVHGKPAAPVIGALLLSALAYALAQTLVAPAIPALTREFGTESSTTSWVLTGFLLSASVCTPLAGKLGDLFGKARVLTGVLLIFSFGSIVSALAGSIEVRHRRAGDPGRRGRRVPAGLRDHQRRAARPSGARWPSG